MAASEAYSEKIYYIIDIRNGLIWIFTGTVKCPVDTCIDARPRKLCEKHDCQALVVFTGSFKDSFPVSNSPPIPKWNHTKNEQYAAHISRSEHISYWECCVWTVMQALNKLNGALPVEVKMGHVLMTLSRQTRLLGRGHFAEKYSATISVSSPRMIESLFSRALLANLNNTDNCPCSPRKASHCGLELRHTKVSMR